MAVSIVDVAELAGVGKSTVSRVLTGDPRVRPSTRARVEQAVRELGYVPNALARGLASGRTQTIGLVVFELHNPFFGLLAHSVELAAREQGYHVLISSSHENAVRQQEVLNVLAERRVDGLLIVPVDSSDTSWIPTLQHRGCRVVLVNTAAGGNIVSSVGVDDVRGAYLAVSHLLSLGHRRVAFLAHPVGHDRRLLGYRKAHTKRKIRVDKALLELQLQDAEPDTMHAAISRLLAMDDPPTAIFTLNDELAIATMQALSQHGMVIPDDISVVGYDDIPVAARLTPPLTTVAQPAEDQGRPATDLLLRSIKDSTLAIEHIVLQPRLVVRQTTAAPRP